MKYFKLIPYYLAWHYSTAIVELILIWRNYLWFALNYFSVKILFLSLLKPFRNIKEGYSMKNLDKELKLVTLLNIFYGFLVRFMSISAGLVFWFLFLVAGLSLLVLWIFLPIILLFMSGAGLAGLMQSNIS